MAYWVAACPSDTQASIVPSGNAGKGAVICYDSQGVVIPNQALEVQLMVVPPAGSGFDGFWQLASIDVADALVVSASIGGVWALAYAFRAIGNFFRSDSELSDD
jgi:hypothetical protein